MVIGVDWGDRVAPSSSHPKGSLFKKNSLRV